MCSHKWQPRVSSSFGPPELAPRLVVLELASRRRHYCNAGSAVRVSYLLRHVTLSESRATTFSRVPAWARVKQSVYLPRQIALRGVAAGFVGSPLRERILTGQALRRYASLELQSKSCAPHDRPTDVPCVCDCNHTGHVSLKWLSFVRPSFRRPEREPICCVQGGVLSVARVLRPRNWLSTDTPAASGLRRHHHDGWLGSPRSSSRKERPGTVRIYVHGVY